MQQMEKLFLSGVEKLKKWLKPDKPLSTPTKICKICFKEIKNGAYHDFLNNGIICYSCLNQLNPSFIEFKIDDVECLAIYEYSDFVKEKIYQYKGCGDFELANVFVGPFALELKTLFRDFEIVLVPSHKEENHVSYMFNCLGLNMHDIFYKSENHKQSDQNYHKRHEVGKFIKFKEGKADLAGKKILLVDDVCTTGSTLKACIKKIKDLNPLNLKVLVIAKRVFSEEELNELRQKEGNKNIEIV